MRNLRQVLYFCLKRLLDVIFSLIGLIAASPILLPVMFLVWKQDRHSPFYVAERIGKDFKPFKDRVNNQSKWPTNLSLTGLPSQRVNRS